LNKILIVFSLFPSHIKKFENFNKGKSKFLSFKEELFLKHTGTSIKLFKKKFIKDELRIYKKLFKKEKSKEL